MKPLLRKAGAERLPDIDCVVDGNECGPATADSTLDGVFEFIGETHCLGARFDWRRNPSCDIEWHILLHKFYYAPSLIEKAELTGERRFFDRWVALTLDWIEADLPPGFIAADVTGRRIQNWIYAFYGAANAGLLALAPPGFKSKFVRSVDMQTEWLFNNLHAARNHRTLELYAILLSSIAFPWLPESASRREFAVAALAENALIDFRQDGGHCEQSSHYHCIVLRNFLNAVSLMERNDIAPPPAMLMRLESAKTFGRSMHRPDGEIAALSDADCGGYSDILGAETQLPARLFSESGYAVFTSERRNDPSWMVFDCGPLGEGNHGHFDAHSIELFGRGIPLIVDPGRFTYDESGPINWRAAFRSTAAHSTIEINGRNQTRYEPGKRKMKITGPGPEARILAFDRNPSSPFIHSRIQSAEYPAIHHRRILFCDDDYFIVADDVLSPSPFIARLRWQLSAEASGGAALTKGDRETHFQSRALSVLTYCDQPADALIEEGWVSRRYGEKTSAHRLCITANSSRLRYVTVLSPLSTKEEPPCISLSETAHSILMTVRRNDRVQDFVIPAIIDHESAAPILLRGSVRT